MNTNTPDVSQYKAVIFDMDGTMINNMGYHKKAWQEFLRRYDIHMTDEEFSKTSGKKNDAIFEEVFGRQLGEDEIQKYTDEKEAVYRELYGGYIEEVKGLTSLIGRLVDEGKKIAIATTAPKENRAFGLAALGLEGKFEVIMGNEHVKHGKPHPEIYIRTAEQLGVDPSDCVVFEDSPPGVQSGKAANMTVIGLLTSHVPDELSAADYLVYDFTEIS